MFQRARDDDRVGLETINLHFQMDRYAELIVLVGLNLHPGQQLIITAPVEAAPFVRQVARHAYRAGASLVTPLFEDEKLSLLRLAAASDDSLDVSNAWLWDGVAKANASGAARLLIWGQDPGLLAEQDAAKVGRANQSRLQAYSAAQKIISTFAVNWCLAAYPTPAWASFVFPGEQVDRAVTLLAEEIFTAARLDQPNPRAAWHAHNVALREKTDWLNARNYDALHFVGDGTDLIIGLADQHVWQGGSMKCANGITSTPNIPTDEVYTAPDKDRVDGFFECSKPLAYQGSLIEGIKLRFEAGRVVDSAARVGSSALSAILGTDEGARRLGEVALVPEIAPVARSRRVFFNTLLDENAASHVALGRAYSNCVRPDSRQGQPDQRLNNSLIHLDLMIGSASIDVHGVHKDGTRQAIMRQGNWV